ncbi:hypothetical protein DFH28DRAFT_1079518 [Melampsora americana]|nr:hypothetical protein DFH28DRAFT_1079518 [Melampsora americana]
MESLKEPIQLHQPIEAIKLNLIRTDSLLIYSGGQTKSNSNQTCHESDSYSKVAHLLNLYQLTFDRLSNDKNPSILQIKEKFDLNQFLKDRVTTEDFALDSWSNLLFSVARFKEFTGHYPHHITVIGHSFKSKRFQEIHREALRWPSDRFEYVAIPDEITDLEARYEGERRVIEEFDRDRYGCFGRLREKRIRRNPFRRFHSYLIGAWELMVGLFEWCPTNGIDWYPHPLPWSTPTP